MSIGRFYAGICALLRSPSGKYLLVKRSADKDFGAGGWECVTGRVDQGEGFREAVRREIYEETGLRDIQIDFMVDTVHFYRGEPSPKNELIGVSFCCSTDRPDAVQLSAEHSEGHWLTPDEVEALLPKDTWIVDLIRRAEILRELASEELLAFYRRLNAVDG
jgi:8-oxo-dGTP pyrophosphatase MutT (NUDIX family)